MVEQAGALSIKASLDTSLLERGFAQIKMQLNSAGAHIKSFFADTERLDKVTNALSRSMIGMGAAAVSTMAYMASSSPAVAGSMAKIEVQTERIRRGLGVALQGEFSKFADFVEGIGTFVETHPSMTEFFALSAGTIAGWGTLVGMVKLITGASLGTTFLAGLAAIAATAGTVALIQSGQAAGARAAETGWETALGTNWTYGGVNPGAGGYSLPEQTMEINVKTGKPMTYQDRMQDIQNYLAEQYRKEQIISQTNLLVV